MGVGVQVRWAPAGLIVTLAGFGVLLDMIGIIVENLLITPRLTIIEEAGEVVVLSITPWFVFRLPEMPGKLTLKRSARRKFFQPG